jgi:hypothetical protein
MNTTDLVFSSHYGKAATVSFGGRQVNSMDAGLSSRAGSSAPTGLTFNSFGPSASDAMSRLLEIVAGMEKPESASKQAAIKEYQTNSADRNAERIQEKMHLANMTKEAYIEDVKSGRYDNIPDGMTISNRTQSMYGAIKNGTAEVYDMEEFGLRSEGTYTLHYTADGHAAGSSGTVDVDHDKLLELRSAKAERNEDGTFTDRETGKNADFLVVGHKFFYVTW